MRPVIHSKKHYVQTSLATITAGTITSVTLVQGVAPEDVNTVSEVVEGAIVKAVFIEDWLRSGEAAGGSFVYAVEKRIGGMNAPSTSEMAAFGDYNNKKNLFYVSQGLLNDANADATPIMRQWIKIPKSKQRFGLGDILAIHIFAQGAIDLHRCGMTTYKEYT